MKVYNVYIAFDINKNIYSMSLNASQHGRQIPALVELFLTSVDKVNRHITSLLVPTYRPHFPPTRQQHRLLRYTSRCGQLVFPGLLAELYI